MSWLGILTRSILVLPAVAQSVDTLVHTYEQPGHGAEKKRAVLDAVATGYEAAVLAEGSQTIPKKVPKEIVVGMASGLTEVSVQLMKILGHRKND